MISGRLSPAQTRVLARLRSDPWIAAGAWYRVPSRERRTVQALARRGLIVLDADRSARLVARLVQEIWS